MAKSTTNTAKVSSINVRMYRAGTGDFFLLQFKKGRTVTFNMMIDCGCINGGKDDFEPLVKDVKMINIARERSRSTGDVLNADMTKALLRVLCLTK